MYKEKQIELLHPERLFVGVDFSLCFLFHIFSAALMANTTLVAVVSSNSPLGLKTADVVSPRDWLMKNTKNTLFNMLHDCLQRNLLDGLQRNVMDDCRGLKSKRLIIYFWNNYWQQCTNKHINNTVFLHSPRCEMIIFQMKR